MTKASIMLTMTSRDGVPASCIIEADLRWTAHRTQDIGKLGDFRPLTLGEIQIAGRDWQMRYVPAPPVPPRLSDRFWNPLRRVRDFANEVLR